MGIVERLRQEFDMTVEWRGVEIHPDTPPGGRPLAELFRIDDINRMMDHLRTMGAQFGITFVDRPFLSNSRLALQAAEFSRDEGKFDTFHEAVFVAYFTHGLDIGNPDVIEQIGRDCGLDVEAMKKAIGNGKHLSRLEETKEDAAQHGVSGVPSFFINEKRSIIGAQPLDVFRRVLRSA